MTSPPYTEKSVSKTTLAYLAGAMDSDGFFSIKKSTYHMRVRRDAANAVYSERLGLKQVTDTIPRLLRDTFGGSLSQSKASTLNGKPLFGYNATDLAAARICQALRPYIRVKRAQVDAVLELGYWRRHPDSHKLAWWWVQENPDWQSMPMLTSSEVATLLHYTSRASVTQALRLGTLVALPRDHNAHREQPRFPAPLVAAIAAQVAGPRKGGAFVTPHQLIAKYEELHERVRELNRIGTGLHPITERTGPYLPAAV